MLSLSIDSSQKRAWLYGGFQTEINCRLHSRTSSSIPVAALFERILSAAPNCLFILEKAEVRDENGEIVHVVKNVRGRPPETQVNKKKAASGEEVFYSSGVVKTPPVNKESSIPEENIPFEFSVHTEFSQFSQQAIEHRLVGNSSSILQYAVDEFDIHLLPKLVPAEVHQIRFGIEHFKRTIFGGLASFTGPNVYQRFFLEILDQELNFTIAQDFGSERGEIPKFEGNLLGPLDYALDSLDLFVDLGNTISKQLTSS